MHAWRWFRPALIAALPLIGMMTASDAKDATPFVRTARTGHATNYDEAKIGTVALPDPLTGSDGRRVTTVDDWQRWRRPELLELYARDVFGRVPTTLPAVHCTVLAKGDRVPGGRRTHLKLSFGEGPAAPHADVVLYVPEAAARPVPLILQIVFLRGLPSEQPEPAISDERFRAVGASRDVPETADPAAVLGRGFAYATFRYSDVQPDNADTVHTGLLAAVRGGAKPAGDAWGTIGVWAWAASRVLDRLVQEPEIDATRVALVGHSRLGKTALWASAQDPRFGLVFASCSGELGAALSRRDFGETIDDLVEVFPWWFAPNFARYAGHWNALPVDAHLLIALSAPRPVFITGASEDAWADPRGEFLAEVAAEPVYRLCGLRGLGTATFPPADQVCAAGALGWLYHTGGHATLSTDWAAFLDFAQRHWREKAKR